ncbi:MAG: hypothetical protein P1U58_17530 [Verrucomicrobiales bacterium]|nr:hypothetical protein [Verrucomicrobiales bacterium]
MKPTHKTFLVTSLVISVILLTSCGSIKTRALISDRIFNQDPLISHDSNSSIAASNKGVNPRLLPITRGIPYHLPTTAIQVEFESKKEKTLHKELVIKFAPNFIPDPDYRFILRSDKTPIYERTRTISVENGLLKTISTNDENRIDDIIKAVTATALTISSGVPVRISESDDANESRILKGAEKDPTTDEQLAALNSIAPGNHNYLMLGSNYINEDIPGTGGLLKMTSHVSGNGDLPKIPFDEKSHKKNPTEKMAAIFTRTVIPATMNLELALDRKTLYLNRIADSEASIKSNSIQIIEESKKLKSATSEDKKKEIQTGIDKLKKDNERLPGIIRRNKGHLDGLSNNATGYEPFLLQEVSRVVMIVDESSTFAISAKPLPMGKTTRKLSFDRGILVSSETSEPSVGLEVARIPLDIAEAIVAVPFSALSSNVDTAVKEQELLNTQLQQLQTLKSIEELQTELALENF